MNPFKYDEKQKILVEDGLYTEYKIDFFDIDKLGKFFFTGTVDVYCQQCKKETTFQIKGPESYKFNDEIKELIKNRCLISVHAGCIRQEESGFFNKCDNEFIAMFYLDDLILIKIGQKPSKADIDFGTLDKAFNILNENDRKELGKGIGLYAHGVGIGSFVYLRRIFERIIEDAHISAKEIKNWDEEKYNKSRMKERIELLKDYLPSRLVKTSHLYSILSKGIHELTEEECMKEFPKIKQAIQLILKEKHEESEYDKIVKEISGNAGKK